MTKPYKYKLTKEDKVHLKEFGIISMAGIVKQMKSLVKVRKTTVHEPCFHCRDIARKLGLPV